MLELYGTQPLKMFGTKEGKRPFITPYRPEIGVTKVHGDDPRSRHLHLIGILIRSIELYRIDIITKVSVLYQHQCNPTEYQMDALYSIVWYLKC